ncbi:unnamed protein product [Polarella glacialis]|uniref:RNA helicase n=1 Tax=Polarella glacialis TaxID=89957 RepID=A0A813GFT7_POLGL|nr:unnamed protein product [Polarella glacialis]CAE8709411.1 unnamed protein product [Polarella glacialis]
MAAPAAEWAPVHLAPVDWSSVRREPFTRAFLDLPDVEDHDADTRRQAMGICVEDRGSARALPSPVTSFEELGQIPSFALESLREHGIVAPLPVQAQALPLVLSGCDVIGLAQTGSGKTMAFLLPAVVHIEAQPALAHRAVTPIALILAPTRELAVQIADEATKVLKRSREGNHRNGIWAVCVYGGGKRYEQIKNLSWGSHIVVATPGRLLDFVSQKIISLARVTYFVLDEADRMLDLGFSGDVDALSSQVRPERQVLFFSATWSASVQQMAKMLCFQGARPVRMTVGQGGSAANDGAARQAREGIIQEVVVVDCPEDIERQAVEKRRLLEEHLQDVLSSSEENKVLVFVSQKLLADELANKLWEAGYKSAAMHGGKPQDSRLWTLDQFRKGDLRLLVATDVVGRGIDIPSVSHVVVFDMGSIDDYVHRIGRTARGKNGKGHALAFFEFWHKDPGIAAELMDLLIASKQPVPEDLKRIVQDVASGKRKGYDPNDKWVGGKWKAGQSWDSTDWKGGGQKSSGGYQSGQHLPVAAGKQERWSRGNGSGGSWPAQGKAADERPQAPVPESWDTDV